MSRQKVRLPAYTIHKASGQARVTIDGKTHYLGVYDTPSSRARYEQLIAEWLANGRRMPDPGNGDLTLVELVPLYVKHAEKYYRKNGRQTSEVGCILAAMKPVKTLYGRTAVRDFGPLALKAIRQTYIDAGYERKSINRNVGRVRRMFKWAASEELIPPAAYHGLLAVSGLQRGRSDARETNPVRPVADAHVNKIKPHVSRQVWAMIELQRLTGMRSGEVCIMRGIDIDMTGKRWVYKPSDHKTSGYGHLRSIELGPKAQKIVKPFLRADTSAFLFDPRDALVDHRAKLRAERKSKPTPSQLARKPKVNPRRTARDRYTPSSYARAITRACELAFPVPDGMDGDAAVQWRRDHHWHPHQLRHLAATRIRKQFGLDAARAVLGQRTLSVTEEYAEIDSALAGTVMAKIG